MRISSVQKGASGAATIAADGGSSFLVDLELLESLGLPASRLVPGAELGEDETATLTLAAEAREAEKRGLALLTRAEQTRFLLRAKLEQRGYSRRAVSLALDRLSNAGWLDDGRFARAYISARLSRSGSKPEGPASLECELQARGIDRATAAAAVKELLGSESEPEAREAALAKAAEKARKRVGDDRDEMRRMLRELGFKSEEIGAYFEKLTYTKDDQH